MKIKSVVIIGLGNIGFKYDLEIKNIIISHTKAILNHNGFNLISGIDENKKNRNIFEKKFNIKTYSSISECFVNCNPDIVVISSPAKTHYSLIKKIIEYGHSKLIICEKPFTDTYLESKKLLSILAKKNVKLIVNYTRRFNPAIIELKYIIKKLITKDYFKGVVFYSKDLKENGSHLIDLMIYFFGEVKSFEIINKKKINRENYHFPDFLISFLKADITFINLANLEYIENSFTLFSKNYSFLYKDDKNILIQKSKINDYTKYEKNLNNYKCIKYKKNINLLFLYNHIFKNFNNKKLFQISNQTTSSKTLFIVEKILKKSRL